MRLQKVRKPCSNLFQGKSPRNIHLNNIIHPFLHFICRATKLSSKAPRSLRLEGYRHMESFITGSSSSSRPIHVYLSFKGDDETCRFTDMLWAALETDDLNTFWYDKKHESSDSIILPSNCLKAIKQSNISIVVFSKSYASSIWCLEELFEIARRIHEPRYFVIPIFYDVLQSDVENQTNSFERAFTEHEQRFTTNLCQVRSWRLAMKQVANLLSGWHLPHDPCPQVIDDIIKEVKRRMCELVYADADLVGMQRRVREVQELLDLGSNDEIRVVGICGMGGIGKSTLGRVVYDRISHHFDASYFLHDRYEFLMCTRMVHGKNILLVLDDLVLVGYQEQWEPLIKKLGVQSRIIIITRDEGVLKLFEKHHIYRVQLLSRDEALQLFYRKAFRCDFLVRGYDAELINRALEYASGLPLAIVELGSYLYNRRSSEWSTALVEFKKVASFMVMKVLKRSFHELDFSNQEMFLDIACFFIGKEAKYVQGILRWHTYVPLKTPLKFERLRGLYGHMPRLIEKSLVTITDQKIQMHSLLQEMGRKIVQQQFPYHPEMWSRLWDFNDIYRVMQNGTATLNVEAIVLDLEDSTNSPLKVEALSRMSNLRLLIFRNVKFFGVLEHLPAKLQHISWHQYPFTSLPSSFQPYCLRELILPDSCISSIWDEEKVPNSSITNKWEEVKRFPSLQNMNLSGSKDLIKLPNFKGLPYLGRLELEGCTKISQLDPSIASVSWLKFLNLRNCSNLVSIPNEIFSRPFLEMLNLACCSKLAHCLKYRPVDLEELGERESFSNLSCKSQKLCRQKSI